MIVVTYLGKTAPENSLNSLFPEDSTDSDQDLPGELDEFFCFMIWNDLSGGEEEEKSSFIEDEELESFLLRTSSLNSMIFMTPSLMMTDIYLKHPITE